MADGPEPLCFTCGLPSGKNARLNHLANGQVCPSCRDRLLETLPAPFPVGVARVAGVGYQPRETALEGADGFSEPNSDEGRGEVRELVHLPRPVPQEDYGPEPA